MSEPWTPDLAREQAETVIAEHTEDVPGFRCSCFKPWPCGELVQARNVIAMHRQSNGLRMENERLRQAVAILAAAEYRTAPTDAPKAAYDSTVPPIWQTVAAIGAQVPEAELVEAAKHPFLDDTRCDAHGAEIDELREQLAAAEEARDTYHREAIEAYRERDEAYPRERGKL